MLAAAFLAVNVMHIQLAHFFISDPYQTFFTVAAILFLVLAVDRHRGHRENREGDGQPTDNRKLTTACWLLASVFIGLAIGSKFAAILLILPLLLAAWRLKGYWQWWLRTAGLTIALTFFLTNPLSVLDFICQVTTTATHIGPVSIPAVNCLSCYLDTR